MDTIITFNPPLPCIVCGKDATVGTVTGPAEFRGGEITGITGYLLQPMCRACVNRTNAVYNPIDTTIEQ